MRPPQLCAGQPRRARADEAHFYSPKGLIETLDRPFNPWTAKEVATCFVTVDLNGQLDFKLSGNGFIEL